MKFSKLFIPFAVFLALMFVACGNDSSLTNASVFPDEVADKAELNTYDCNMSVIGKKVFVTDLGKNYECDGEEWFESYDQPKSSAKGNGSSSSKDKSSSSNGKSSSSKKGSSSSSAKYSSSGKGGSNSAESNSSSSQKDEGSKKSCTEVPACDAMVKTDVSTWHFVRDDSFGDDAEYTYRADGRDLIVTIKNSDGSKNSNTYSMYNMESEVGVEMAFKAAQSTCEDGNGNDRMVQKCVSVSSSSAKAKSSSSERMRVLPDCDESRDGLVVLRDEAYLSCREGRWVDASFYERNVFGEECVEEDVGKLIKGHEDTTITYCCTLKSWVDIQQWSWYVPKEIRQGSRSYGTFVDERDGQVYKTTRIDGLLWMAENLNYADSVSTPSLLGNSWCYNDVEANCSVGGRLYTWAAAIDSLALAEDKNNPYQECDGDTTCLKSIKVRGVCPEGWYLPNYAIWDAFTWYSSSLKTTNGWRKYDLAGWRMYNLDGNGNNSIGFSAMPTGVRNKDGKFANAGVNASYWASTAADSARAYAYDIDNDDDYGYFNFGYGAKNMGMSIRCVKD